MVAKPQFFELLAPRVVEIVRGDFVGGLSGGATPSVLPGDPHSHLSS